MKRHFARKQKNIIYFWYREVLLDVGYVRIAYCVAYETIVNALPKFKELAKEYQLG